MPCLDTKTMTQHLAHFDRINLGRPLAITHFCLDLKSIERSKCHFNQGKAKARQNCTELPRINQGA